MLDLKIEIKKMLFNMVKKQDINMNKFSCRIKAAINYIEQNYNKKLSLEEVANYVNINTYYFSSIFKKDTGMCFTDYLQKVRIENSKKLLMQPQYKIYQIAEKIGFTDEKYYFKVFKKYTGITPSQYRNKL
jgi:YesN/AraC family two-component response regulator